MTDISVIIPTYNRANKLPRAIDSVLQQSFLDFEVIVVDDGSTDCTADIMRKYRGEDKIRYIRFKKNRGANAARNKGIREAKGELISFLDSDDELLSTHLERVKDILSSSSSEVGGVYTGFKQIQNNTLFDFHFATNILDTQHQVVEEYNVGGFSVLTFKKEVFNKVGLLNENLSAYQDREFLFRYLQKYQLYPVDCILVVYYIHDDRLSSDTGKKLKALTEFVEIHGEEFTKEGIAHISYTKAFLYARQGDMGRARQHFRYALYQSPTKTLYWFQYVVSMLGQRGFFTANKHKRWMKKHIVTPVINKI